MHQSSFSRKLTETAFQWKYVPEDSIFAENNGLMLIIKVDADRSSLTGRRKILSKALSDLAL